VLFPEATTGDGNRLKRFHSSHFESARRAPSRKDGRARSFSQFILFTHELASFPCPKRTAGSGVVRGHDVPSPFFQFVRRGRVTCDVYVGVPIQVSPSLDRKSAARLAKASIWNLAIRAWAAPAPFLC
jgi:hypothetical protein